MSDRHTFIRSLHDLGIAAWFGGSLMGAVGLNGATAQAKDPVERLRLSSDGWARWAPVQIAAVAAHTVGGIGLIAGARRRLQHQPGTTSLTVAKLVVTAAAAGTTAYAGVLGLKIKQHEDEGGEGVTEPSASASRELQATQRQLKTLQWATPLLTGVAVVLGAAEGEQQRVGGGLLELGAGGVAREAVQAWQAKGDEYGKQLSKRARKAAKKGARRAQQAVGA